MKAARSDGPTTGRKVVIVDDSTILVRQLQAFLEEIGYEVVATGADGLQAVELYRVHRPDLLTLDITMPRKDGLAALDEILGEFPSANIMIISALRGPEMARCLRAGAKAYMEKPLQFQDSQYLQDFKASLKEAFSPRQAG